MARQTISSGKAPIVWSTVDSAFNKINANFQELYASIGSVNSVDFTSLNNHLQPSVNATYDLGFPTRRWRNLYLSNSLSLGGVNITSEGLHIDLPSGSTVGGELIIDPNKSYFKEIQINNESSISADQFNDTLNLTAGTGIEINLNSSSDTIIFDNAGVTRLTAGTAISISGNTGNVTVNNAGVTGITAGLGMSRNSATGSVTVVNEGIVGIDAGTGISVGARDSVTGKVIITNTAPAGNAYRIIAVNGEPSLTARSSGDTITFIKGNGINITNTLAGGAFTNRVTFENTGVLSLTVTKGLRATSTTGNITLDFDPQVDIVGSVFAEDSTIIVNASTKTLTGNLVGTADVANAVGLVATNTSAATHYVTFVDQATGNRSVRTDTALSFNPLSNTLTSTNFSGNLTGNVNGSLDGDVTGSVFGDDSTVLVDGTGNKIVGPVETTRVTASVFIQTGVYANLAAIASALPVPSKGMIVFDDNTKQFRGFDGSSWVALN